MKKIFIILMILISTGFIFAQSINQGIVNSHSKVYEDTWTPYVDSTWEIEIKAQSVHSTESVLVYVYSNYPINIKTDDFCQGGFWKNDGRMVVRFIAKKDYRNKITVRNEKADISREIDITKYIEKALNSVIETQKMLDSMKRLKQNMIKENN